MKKPCGCVSKRAKGALVMLAEATMKSLRSGKDGTLPYKGKVGPKTLAELEKAGYIVVLPDGRSARIAVTSKGGDKILEWHRMGWV